MANWYWGVLKYVFSNCSASTISDTFYSTGRRRYGHPALTGVLPTPWLPLKKGQTLANYIEAQSSEDGHGDKGDAVVLTLRKRPRRDARQSSRAHTPGPATRLNGSSRGAPDQIDNPWREESTDSRPGNGSQELHRRLSFDQATGIIMLPEDSDWMGEDESSSDDVPGPMPTESSTRQSLGEEGSLPVPTPRSPTSQNRHSTYYHHPERRRSRMPGGFPRS